MASLEGVSSGGSGGRQKAAKLGAARRRFVLVGLVPCAVFFLLFRLYPFANTLNISLHEYSVVSRTNPFVALQNYQKILSEGLFRICIWNSLYYSVATTLFGTVVALAIALLIHSLTRLAQMYRAIYFLPQVTSTIAVAMVWRWLYQPVYGFLNQVLQMLALPTIPWLRSPTWAMPSIVIMGVWGGIGMSIIILLAGLNGIPGVFYEACMIDGGNRWHLFRHITLPLLQPTLAFILVTGFMGGFNVFASIYIMTQGGPLNRTRVLAYHIYQRAFVDLRMGEASAMAFVLFIIVLAVTIFQLRVMQTRWEY